MQFRFAECEADRTEVFRQRYRVYTREMNLYAGIADHARGTLSDADDRTGRILAAFDDTGAAGSLRVHVGLDGPFPTEFAHSFHLDMFVPIVPLSRMAIITRFTLDPRHRGGRLAFGLMVELSRHLLDLGIQLAFLDCVPHLINLYTSIGFRPYASNVDDPHAGILVPMVLVAGDLDFLRAIRSPLTRILAEHLRLPEVPPGIAELLGTGAGVASEGVENSGFWAAVAGIDAEAEPGEGGIFAGLDDEHRRRLLAAGHVIESRRGDTLVRKGTVGRSMFIVLEGTVSVRDGERLLALRGPGSVLGEIAFLVETPRTADVRAETDGSVLNLDERTVRQFIQHDSVGAAKLLLNLARILCRKLAERPIAAVAGEHASGFGR